MIKKAVNSLVDQIVEALMDWIYTLIYGLYVAILEVVDFISSFFDVFAGTSKVMYNGKSDFLLNMFFSHDSVTNAFWAMALIAIVLAFGFCIFNLSRIVTNVSGTMRQTVGQVMGQFVRCMLVIVLLNAIVVASVNISGVLLDRINFALLNAQSLDEDPQGRTFTEQEYATMTKILATIGNYSVNPSADNRYNINACFNAVRGDLQALRATGVFDYHYEMRDGTHHTWQSALAMLATSADLTQELSLDQYDDNVARAILTISDAIKNDPGFKPVERVQSVAVINGSSDTDILLFLITGITAAKNEENNTGDLYDTLRLPYATGEKKYSDIGQVKKDFDIQKIDYFVGFIAGIVFIIVMALCIFTFIVRLFNLLLLYITSPLFASTIPLDEGGKFQAWVQSFSIQLFSGFGLVVGMRLYTMVIPLITSSQMVFFQGSGLWNSTLNWFAKMLMILGGAWAVLKSGGLITAILSGSPGMHASGQEASISAKVTRGARAAVADTASLIKALPSGAQKVLTAPAALVGGIQNWGYGVKDKYRAVGDRRRAHKKEKADRAVQREAENSGDPATLAASMSSGAALAYQSAKNNAVQRPRSSAASDQSAVSKDAPSESGSGPAPQGDTAAPTTPRQRTAAASDRASGGAAGKKGSGTGFKVPDHPKPPPLDSWVGVDGGSSAASSGAKDRKGDARSVSGDMDRSGSSSASSGAESRTRAVSEGGTPRSSSPVGGERKRAEAPSGSDSASNADSYSVSAASEVSSGSSNADGKSQRKRAEAPAAADSKSAGSKSGKKGKRSSSRSRQDRRSEADRDGSSASASGGVGSDD